LSPFGRFFLKTPLPHQLYTAFQPDIMLGDADTMDLASFGVNGIVRRIAGHTPGSISVELSFHIVVCTEKA
jgi:hydroxyacylglutathione hydrolase